MYIFVNVLIVLFLPNFVEIGIYLIHIEQKVS